MPGFAYRLRLINAIAVECPVYVSIDRHTIVVIASDGKPVKPVSTRKVQLYPGNYFFNRIALGLVDPMYSKRYPKYKSQEEI